MKENYAPQSNNGGKMEPDAPRGIDGLHPSWRAFIRYCSQLRHGEIERLCIQDGVPVLAETTIKKVKFTS
jgi:hypothetical protein